MPLLSRIPGPAAALLCIWALPVQAGDLNLTRSVKPGLPSPLGYERSWDGNCQDTGAIVTVTSQPGHGTVSIAQKVSLIPASTPRYGSTGRCAGRSIKGKQVLYRSQPGFHGRDHLSWHVAYGNGKSGDVDMTVIVP